MSAPTAERPATVTTAEATGLARTLDVFEVAARYADSVDEAARFPQEAMDALREARLLGALIPVELGGLGLDLEAVCDLTRRLGRSCSSTAMIFAMHQIQVATLLRHGTSPELRAYTERVAAEQLLLASATTELNIGGSARTSNCAIERDGDAVHLVKQASVISYGNQADGTLTTARRTADSPANDQVLVLCRSEETRLDQTTGWDTMGLRGTCSVGFVLTTDTTSPYVFDDSFDVISSHTMLPISHLLWASGYLGIAEAAEIKARHFVASQARKHLGTVPPGALRLAELHLKLQSLRESVGGNLRRYTDLGDELDHASDPGFVLAFNTLKVSAAALLAEIVSRALAICGMAGYANKSPFSLARLVRDSQGAPLMVSNDRILANNAQLLLMYRED